MSSKQSIQVNHDQKVYLTYVQTFVNLTTQIHFIPSSGVKENDKNPLMSPTPPLKQ